MKEGKSIDCKKIKSIIIFILFSIVICMGGTIAYKYLYVDKRIEGFEKKINEDRSKLKLLEENIEKMQSDSKFNEKNDDKVEIESLGDYYKDITESCISNISLIISIFLGIGGFFTLANILEIIQVQDKISKVDKIEEKYTILSALSYLNKGLNYENNERYNFAIDEYKKGLEINNMLVIRNQLASAYAELAGGCGKEKAKYYLEKGIKAISEYFESNIVDSKMKDKRDEYEAYSILACLYGRLGKLIGEDINDVNKCNLKKSEEYFSKSLEIDRDYKYLKNYALTLYYLDKIEKMTEYFQQSKSLMNEIGIENEDVMNIFSTDEIKRIGFEKWNEYRRKVGLNEDEEEKYNERCNLKKCEV